MSENEAEFRSELVALINKYSKENRSDTPDFVLAEFISDCLLAFDTATINRELWYGGHGWIRKEEG